MFMSIYTYSRNYKGWECISDNETCCKLKIFAIINFFAGDVFKSICFQTDSLIACLVHVRDHSSRRVYWFSCVVSLLIQNLKFWAFSSRLHFNVTKAISDTCIRTRLRTSWCYRFCCVMKALYQRSNIISRDMTNPTIWVCSQRRLKAAWASAQSDQSLRCATQWVAKNPSFLHADSEDSDQTGRMPRLIWDSAGRTVTLSVLSCRGSLLRSISRNHSWNQLTSFEEWIMVFILKTVSRLGIWFTMETSRHL